MRAAIMTMCVLGAMLDFNLQAAEPAATAGAEPVAKPAESAKPAEITGADLAKAVEGHIAAETKVADGSFVVRDPVHAEDVPLTLVSVHNSPVRKTGENTYVVCADFKNAHGEPLDVDFFVAGATPEKLKVTSVFVHANDGHARYAWVEQGGIWQKQATYEVKKVKAPASPSK